ncbi:LOW QUALITY PROTEIN: dystonin [Cuculus canorus]|uniref:LOW QUALITY PROTEIN: dystonin n=1 Tax=Cuculus canorus TaxID=55661 RepID=UPI0023AA297D|nr:LOW QUALITY PROTEIN: dystonin [Cuculus canorus]
MPAPLPAGGAAARRCPAPRRPPQPRTGASRRLSHDRRRFLGAAETLQHPMRSLPAPAAAGHHRHDFILLLLAPQAAEGQAPHPLVFSGRSRSRDAVMRTHHFRSEGFRSSPRHARRRVAPRLEETQPLVEAHHLSEQETSVRKRKIKKSSRVQPEFYHSVQVTPTRKPSSGNASYRCSMSSSADFSDEEDFSQRSGTVSPAPGDTLPWNLPKHERSKRKIQGGSVLDPAERAVLRIADERDKVQKKTFTKWINQHLMKVRKHVNDLYEDLRDGHNLISLLEVLSGDTLPREKGRMRFHRLQNVQIALDYLRKRQVKLVNIRNDDITDGNPKLTLGLIWTIILHFQISDIHVTGESQDMSAKERLLLWSQQTTEGYAGVRCENFTTCWRDGRLFNAIIHKYRPDLIDMNTVAVQSNLANLEHAFFVAEKLGVARLLDPEDVDVSSPDEKSVITYVSSLYDAFPKVPEGGEGIGANDVEVKWVEYQNMVNYLTQWIRHHVTIMSDRTFPNSPVELKALYSQYLQFKETEIPPKETDKSKIKRLYKLLEVWIEFGRIKLPQGYHPNDIEKEWGKLIIAMLEREKTLRPEVERLEMLQQIANRIQRDSRSCEDKLILARNALHSDTKRLESGLQFQHEAEIAGYLLESENLLRQQVIDVQILIDGKYYQADQLVQRVAKLHDELMAIRSECASIYNKGHALTTEQTKLMISGITESLNSGFTTNLPPELNTAMTQGLTPTLTSSSLTSGLSSGLSSRLTPTIAPAYTPGIPPRLIQSYVTGVDSGTLQTLKLMQIRKPLMKSAFVDQNLTEEEVNMKFVQDLLSWVEEMQVQLDRAEWGSDLPSVESHLENHKNVHRAIEEFESSLKEAKISEIQMTAPLKLSYAEKLHKLESQYSKLLNTSRNQERHLDTLHNFVSRATKELIWLNEKEEEEVAYDWSERNPNITRKKEYHAELMRELDQKEEVIKSVQEIAEQLLLENHPARLTIEAYRAAMQTQWSWILQLCHCVEQHLRENAAYFEFFTDAKEAMEYLKNLKDTIYRKYSCDRSSSLHRLEDLVQESMEEKEQLLQYKSTVAGLVGRAKAIIQLKPRNPDCILKTSIPIKAICDYRQIEITIYKDDECVLANNSHRAKWKVISPSGNEAMVPSVCFTVPPPNKEAIDTANRIEQQFQNVLALWHESHVNMKSVVSWHYLTNEIEAVRAGNVASIKTMLPGEHQQVLSNLQSRFDDFVEDSQESKIFTSSDTAQLEREVNVCKQYYQELLKSAEREEQEESVYNLYISEVRNIRLQLESCEERLIQQIRTPMERDDMHESTCRISEQEKLKKELDRLKDNLGVITAKCEEFFIQAAGSPSVPTLRSELNVVIQNMNQVYSMSSIYIDKLKTVSLVLKNTHEAELLVKHYETKLCEEEAVTADKYNIENLMGTLKQWRSEVDEKRYVFHALEDELQKAKMISDQMFKMHKERDLDFDWHKEKADQLAERWQNVHSQIENRLRDLEGINKSLKYYKDTYNSLDTWIQQVEDTQRKIQEIHSENSKALAKQLNQHKMLVSEIEMKQSKIDECQKYAEQYSAAVKDYELQTMTYRAMVDSQQKSPVKRRRMQSSSDFIIQEFMDLRTRYTALVTLMTQYIKFAGDSLKRLEEEEKSMEEEKKEHVEKAGDLLKWVSNLSKTLSKEEGEKAEKTDLPKQQISLDEMSTKKEQIAEALQTTQSFLAKHGDKMTEEERNEMEKQVRSLQESYSLLSNEALKQLQEAQCLGDEKMEEKVNKVIAGVIDRTTGEVLSVFQSILKGFIDYDTGIRLLENQLILSGIISPELGMCYNLEEAKAHGLIDEQTLLQLQELSNAKKLISESSLSNLPVISALEQGLISEPVAIKILENQLSSGHLILPSTGENLTLQNAFQRNLISPSLYSKLLERKDTCKDLIDPNCAEKISFEQMVHRSIIHEESGLRLLPVKPQEKGRITFKCGRKITVLRAAHEGLIDRETLFRLLGAQLVSGGIIDPDSGERMTVEEAMKQGVIDQDTACGILTHQVQTGGILCPNSGQRLTVDEAVQCNLISSTSALLVLEAQRGFVGLIWPHTGEIFPISTSLHQEMITNELAFKILNDRQKIAALYIPETCEIVSLDKAAQSGLIDSNTVSILTNLTLPDKMPSVEGLESRFKNAAKWLSMYEFLPSVSDEREEEHEDPGSEDTVCNNLDQAKKLFVSYLMVNSYMDANTGGRLLLYDGQLREAVNMLLEGNGAVYNDDESEMEFNNRSLKGINLKSTSHLRFNNITGSVQGDLSGAESTSSKRKLNGNCISLEEDDLHVCRPDICNAIHTEQSEYTPDMLLTNPTELRNVLSSTQNSMNRNALRDLPEVSEWTELCKHNSQKANSGSVEEYLPYYSNPNLISETEKEKIYMEDSVGNENSNDKTLQNSLSVNDLADNETWKELERNTKYVPQISQADSSRVVLDSSKKDDFLRSLGSFISADTERRLAGELASQWGDTPQFEKNRCSEQPVQDYADAHSRPSLEDYLYVHGRLSLEDSTDWCSKLCLEASEDMHCRPLLDSETVIHDGPPLGDSNSTAGSLTTKENSLTFQKLLPCDSSSDSSIEESDDISQFESNCLQHECGEVASEDDSSQFEDDDDDAYETPQVDDDDSDVYDTPQIDDGDSYNASQGSDGFDTLHLRDDEPELSGTSVPLGFLEERGGIITLREETRSSQGLATNAGKSIHVKLTSLPKSLNIASASAMERICEEQRERTESFEGKEQKLPITLKSEGGKEGGLSSLQNTCETKVQDRNEEDEMRMESDSYEDESEGMQEEDYYDSYDYSDTDSDTDEEMNIFYSRQQCINKGDQLLISFGNIENSYENNQNVDDCCCSLGHMTGYTLQFQSNDENGKLSSGKCESASEVSEERCVGLTCTNEEDRQQEPEGEYETCIESKCMSQDNAKPIQPENTFGTKWVSCKSEDNKTQLGVPGSQLLDDTVTSDVSITAFLTTKQVTDDDESTGASFILSECHIDSVNKNNSTMPNHGQRQREAVFAEEKVSNDMSGMEQLKASSSQMDNRFLTAMSCMSDGDSSLSDQVHPVTSWKHGQVGGGFENITEDRSVNIMEECGIMVLSKSPIQMESLGEIFDASVIKTEGETPISSKEKVSVDQALLDVGGGVKSDEFKRDLNISAALKQCTTGIKEESHSELNRIESCCFEDEKEGKNVQNEKKEMLSSEFNCYSLSPTDTVKPKEISVNKEAERVLCQNTDNVLKDFLENKSRSDSEFSPIKADALGRIEDAKESGAGSEVLSSGSHTRTTDVSSAILSTVGTGFNYGTHREQETLTNEKGENFMASETSSLGNAFKNQMSVKSIQKETGLCRDFQVKEGISQRPEMPDTVMEGLKSLLQRKLKMGQVYCKQEGEPLSYSDTKILMQNLLTMVRSTQLGCETSGGTNLKQISNAVGAALMATTPCMEPKDRDALSLLWPDCRSPDLLRDVLKQESCRQKMDDPGERKSETDAKVSLPKLTASELLEIFHVAPEDESTSKLEELISSLLTSSQVGGITTGCEGKGRVGGLCTLFSTEQSEFGSEIAEEKTLADDKAVAWRSEQEHGKTDGLSKGFTEPVFETKEAVLEDTPTSMVDGVQQCLKLTEKMRGHLAVLQDMKKHLDNQPPISDNLEILKDELERLESFESGLAAFAIILKKDMKLTEEFLKFSHRAIPEEKLKELKISYECLQEAFVVVCDTSSKQVKQIVCAVDSEMSKLAVSHQQLLSKLQRFSDWITENGRIVNDFIVNTNDIEEMKRSLQLLKNSAAQLGSKKMQLESTAFDVQFFISEHAQDLSPNQSKQLLRLLNTTQKSFQEAQEAITSQVASLETQLQAAQELGDQKDVAERQQECREKLQEICDLLTQTENRLIGQQESLVIGDSKAELEQYQTKQEEIQKDMRMSAQTLAEIVRNTETFLKENGDKLSQEDKTVLEQKLNEAKTKCLLLSQKAEESKKELDKAMTTAIKQETEKVAAIEQLEESKNTIENLLDWLSNVDKESEHGRKFKQAIEQNGTHFEEGDMKGLEEEEDDVNGNLLETQEDIETRVDGLVKSTDDNLNQQYQKVKAQHEKIISQQQAVIIATQSAQALLEKQGHYLSPEEKEKMQRNMKELKAQYETALADSERKMKLTRSLREELEKFDADYSEFETWLQQAEQELDNLEAGASDFSGIMVKLKRQKSFSEDVISHKGDLRYITISGQRVLDAARSCSKRDGVKVDKDGIDTSATYTEVQNKLDTASDRFKSLYSKCSILGNNLKDLVDKYQHYEDASSGLRSGLQASEVAVNKQLSEPVAVDPKNLQRQLEETKILQGQLSNHQIAVEKLKKAAEVLLDTRGELAPDKDEIQKTLDDIVERYDNLSKSVNERNEKLQVTLTRSLSVQDGLDEMLDWMEGVEKSLEEQDQVPLNSTAIQDIISKSIMLEQDIAGRQSSINTMNEKVKKFTETADPSTASTLRAKMSELAGRFSEASNKHKEKLMKMEELKTKVELFESLSEKLQSFLDEKNQALSETEAPRKDVSEVSQYMQEASVELTQHKKDLEVLQRLLEELSVHALPGDKALVLEKVNALSKKFREVEETVKEKEEDVSSCQQQMDTFELLVESLKKWIKETTERIPAAQPSLNTEELKKPLEDTLNLKDEWTLKAPELQKMNSRGTLLCNLITAVTSPAKLRAVAKSGGTMLNGEGGAPGTQDFLKNKELTAVQQAMSDVNHSYEDLGVLLKEKISELESTLSKMQNIQEESTSMMQWLQKMDKTASDWEAAPTDSEAVKAQVEQHKLFETELKQSANKVQELKDKVTELLEKNPDSPEAPKWRQTLDKIDSKWKELNRVTSERQQKLEESSNYLTQFQTAEAQLKHWLAEKELMVSVLGPLSIDPNMLNTQKQQVQILLKEFDTRKPQYEQLTVAGEGILKRPGERTPSHEIVKEQLAAVAQQWDSLTGQLRNRYDRIDQAIVKSTEYQSLLRSLSDKLSALDSKLSSSLAVSTQPDAVKQQLEIAREMKEEIEQERKNINAAQALCEELSTLVGEDYLKAELTRQLDGILKSFKDIEQKSDNHVQQLQSAYATSHQFQQMSKDFQGWLGKKKEELNQARPVSAKLDALQSLIEEQKDFKKAMTDQISSYERIVAEGESILQKAQGADKAALQSQVATLRSNWEEMNKQVKVREDKLTDCLERALKYKQHVENLQPWIEKCQSNLCELKVGINPVEIENSIVQVKAWQKDLDKHHGMVELLNNSAESLLSAVQTDKEIVQEETKILNQKVNVVTEQLHKKRECLENMAHRLKEFQELSRESEKQLKSAKEHLEAHDSLGPQSFSNKHLTMMQAQQKSLQALKPHVDLAKKLAQDLVVEASDSAGVSDLLLQAESLEREYTAVNQQVEDRCSFLEAKLQGIGHFQNSIREMFSQFAEFDDELDSMAPVGRDLKVLQSQREDIKRFLKKLEDLIMNNENANKNCKIMLATDAEASPDLVGIKRDLEALNKQCNKLLDRAKAREDQVEGTISRVEEFYSKLEEFSSLLGRAEEHEESQGPVGMETETINQQLNAFKVFQKEEIEPLQVKQQEVNWLGQGLIQSAAKSTNTENLEHDLEDVNTRWKTLNKKVAQRAAQLQEALLHCGRFQDALESLLSWLIDTEELVANQKPPSAEFKVVKAQIQEQKLLQRLLDDRKPTVEAIKREGEKIAESAEPADRVKILKQLSFLDSRWDALLSKAETRNRQLEGISVVAQQFHEALEPLMEWLTATEKRLANAEPIGTQASKLQQQISQHKALEDDVLAHNKSLHQAISTGHSLKTLSSREDKDMVQEKLDSSQARYIEIQEKSNSRSKLLQQAYSNAQIFGEDEVELMNWLNEIHDKLSRLSVEDCSTELLEKQHSELLDLEEEILLRKQNVDLAIQNGLELLKQTTGDEVLIIQDKLEGIKARYKDITKLSSDVSKTLEQALQLAGQLHSTHEELCKWLDKVEVELISYETQIPTGEELSVVQERQKELKKEAKNNKCLLDTLNEVGSAFLELVPWRAREGLDKLITEDNERYRLVSDTISQKVDEIDAAILRSQQFDQAADAEFAWIAETEKKLMSLGDIRLEQEQTTAQLQVQKAFTMEILKHKDNIDELVKSGDKIMNTCTEEEKQTMKKKMKSLLQKYDALCQMNSERNLQLERAQSLVNQFWETYEELWPWLTETEMIIAQLPAPALEYETLKQQQEEHRQLRELIAEHKPHIDKMNKTGPQLLELSPGEGFSIQEKYVAADTLYSKIKEDVKKRALALDEAISQCTQFHDKIDQTLESLKRIVERLRQPPSISAEVEKIKEQISENKNVSVDLEKLQPVYETLKQRGEEMIARTEGADKDISAKAVQDKLDQMVHIWEDIQTLTEEREAKLLDVMELAEKFWCDHMALVATIKDTQDFIRELEGPGVDPSVVKQQQETAEAAKEEIDGLQEELEAVVSLGSELRAACGEPDKPIVNKSIDELNSAWDALNKTWKERVDKLAEAMQAAVQYQDGLQAIFDWVDIAGSKLASMSPVGTDLETVKQQTEELKQFKTEAYQQQIEMERLNHQAELLLKKATQESDKHTVQDPLSELKLMWDTLEEKIINRQHKLEGALLALGQFQHALDELLTWLTHTEDLLNEQKPVGGDPKAIEIELAKHHVLQNDVLAHQSTVEAVKKAGNDLIASSAVEEASNLQSKLELLNQRWQNVLEKTEQRKQQLDSALIQAQGFHGEVEDMQQWLTDTERQLLASKPVGGLPETAREQLNSHMELCAAFEAKEETYKCLMQKGQQMLARCPESAETNVEQDINNLKEKWESVQTKLSERKTKLEEALNLAMEFHNSLQDFINWLTQAEQTLTAASQPSLILDTVLFQIDEHKVFATEVNSHRDQIMELDKTGTHLKYFSQKQDVVLIKNLLISVQSRWEKVVQRLVERGRALDDARKRAKQFHEAWHKLMEWLEESEKSLNSDLEIANDPDKIKMQLAQHKEFQKSLGAKHSVYDATNRTGRSLKEKTTLADDNLKLDDMLSELRDKWDTICGKSVERQNKLEEALLFSGQFTDALQALIDWLYKVEPQLAEDQPVHGDSDLVMNLIDNHKVFQKELGKRTSSVQALKRSARELIEGSRDDSSWVKVQMQELSTRWETVCALSVSKQTRLEQALRQAEEFHSVVHALLEWMAEAEQALRFHGVLPDDEEALRTLIEQHREFMKKLEEKKAELNKATSMGEAILAICHPDSITTIKHWITIIRARFEEVLAWAKQHQQKLSGALAGLIANQELLEALLSWLQWAETTLTEKDKEVIPQEIEEVKALIAEHQTFMEEMTRKQPDVDKVTKTYKRKPLEPTPVQSHIPVLDKGRAGRKRSPTPGIYPSAAQTQIETKNPRVNLLVSKWQQVWLLALERRRKLNDALDRLEELKEFANFDFDIWRKKYMRWMNHKKSRVMDFFRRIDKDQDGKITRQEFIDGILSSKFPTSRLEMSAVADIFDRDGDGYIDYYEFVAALHPNKDAYKPLTDADKIEDEVTRQVAKCKCAKRFQVEQIGDNKYRFGDSQQLRLVRILRSTVMVRVGGGWMALDEFLVKNDPCRAKGRTNVELREKFILADGASQSMAAFRPRGRRSRPSSRGASPNRSTSLSSQAGQAAAPQAVATSTPKTPHHLTRNYGKPWLTNSKTSTPPKPPESSDYQGSSTEGTPIQGSKLRLPGYLSGKGFHSGEDSGILSTAATRVRAQFAETRRTPSRPGSRAGSKAGSRSSSRRGSDASDFDISEIQSVCSDMSETVPATSRPTPRAGSRPGSAKPSKIPTPQRRPLASKLDKSLKR